MLNNSKNNKNKKNSNIKNKFQKQFHRPNFSDTPLYELFFFPRYYSSQYIPGLGALYDIFSIFLAQLDLGESAVTPIILSSIGYLSTFLTMIPIPGVSTVIAPLSEIIETFAIVITKFLIKFIKIIQVLFAFSGKEWSQWYMATRDLIPMGEEFETIIKTNTAFITNRLDNINSFLFSCFNIFDKIIIELDSLTNINSTITKQKD